MTIPAYNNSYKPLIRRNVCATLSRFDLSFPGNSGSVLPSAALPSGTAIPIVEGDHEAKMGGGADSGTGFRRTLGAEEGSGSDLGIPKWKLNGREVLEASTAVCLEPA